MLIASRPILTSHYKGSVRGALVMGRCLDSIEIESDWPERHDYRLSCIGPMIFRCPRCPESAGGPDV